MKPISIMEISKKRFQALAGQTRAADAHIFSDEIAWYSNEDESILGVILIDKVDNDFVSILLGRDENNFFRAFDLETSIETKKEAENWLFGAMKWQTSKGQKVFPQGIPHKGINLFEPIIPVKKQHAYFIALTKRKHFHSAKSIINALMPYYEDIDGNFVEQFQSTGFDSRLWELYLNTYFKEDNLNVSREHHAPDFIIHKYGIEVAIEAVIVGRKGELPKLISDADDKNLFPKEHTPERIISLLENEMPIRFGSPLFSKLEKKYWNLPHVKGKALIFAIADFHEDVSMIWSSTALINYLYGYKHHALFDQNGNLMIKPEKIDIHKLGKKEIPSGYFFQEDAENISAVLFSASGTISKFNRIGRQAGFKDGKTMMIRIGTFHDHDPNATVPIPFKYIVDEKSNETWGEGISMFHNPNALHPVPEDIFPSIAHHHFSDGQIISNIPEFHPYGSYTLNIVAV